MPRVFSIKRALLSVLLGLLIPLGYAYSLHLAQEYLGIRPTELMLLPFAWPRWVLVFVTGRYYFGDDEILHVLVFVALANILLYGTLLYVALTLIPQFWKRGETFGPPPAPEYAPTPVGGGSDMPMGTDTR